MPIYEELWQNFKQERVSADFRSDIWFFTAVSKQPFKHLGSRTEQNFGRLNIAYDKYECCQRNIFIYQKWWWKAFPMQEILLLWNLQIVCWYFVIFFFPVILLISTDLILHWNPKLLLLLVLLYWKHVLLSITVS